MAIFSKERADGKSQAVKTSINGSAFTPILMLTTNLQRQGSAINTTFFLAHNFPIAHTTSRCLLMRSQADVVPVDLSARKQASPRWPEEEWIGTTKAPFLFV